MISNNMPSLVPAAKDWRKWNGREWWFSDVWEENIITDKFEFYLTVHPGFKTDGGSIPDIFQNIIAPLGKNLLAFLVHDALYATEYCTRAQADWILLELCEYLGASWPRRNAIYLSVRAGGWPVWGKHTKKSIATARALIEFKPVRGFEEINLTPAMA